MRRGGERGHGTPPPREHHHPEYWSRTEQHRYEERTDKAIDRLTAAVDKIGGRLTWLLGGIAVLTAIASLALRYLAPAAGGGN